MEQVYYTQCPVGYGLGVANGFQVKRRSAGYPVTGDFRHLSLRPFLPGTRDLAPPALRYRRDGAGAEVAWLRGRTHEYETENGRLWGRPGGQFAHGVRLTDTEFVAIRRWPAGLYGAGFWVVRDPVRTLDQAKPEPEPIAVWPPEGWAAPELRQVAEQAGGESVDWLAGLIAAAARSVATERTLFLIETPERLVRLISWMTFLMPEPLRADLTFSTYHDRPEELSGLRIQGTVPEAKVNRMALARLGIIADGAARTMDPPQPEPPAWARCLAEWLVRHDEAAVVSWNEWNRLASQSRRPVAVAESWSDEWLNQLAALGPAVRRPAPVPTGRTGWKNAEALTRWSHKAGLLHFWSVAHDPAWWLAAASTHAPIEATNALLVQLSSKDGWGAADTAKLARLACPWGEAVARWLTGRAGLERAAVASLARCPLKVRGAFLAGLVRGLQPSEADATITQLKQDPQFHESLLLPVEALRLAAATRAGESPESAAEIVERCLAVPEATVAGLEAIAHEIHDDQRWRAWFADRLADALDDRNTPGWSAAWSWGLQRTDGSAWLGPFLIRVFAGPDWQSVARTLRDRTPDALRPSLARAALAAGRQQGVRPEAFVWGVEALLLPARSEWFRDPSWPNDYLDRVDDLDILDHVLTGKAQADTIAGWIQAARQRGLLHPRHQARLDRMEAFGAILARRDLTALAEAPFPDVPESRRGEVLDRLGRLGNVGTPSLARVLEVCRIAWPGGFDPGGAGLPGIGGALAKILTSQLPSAEKWLIELRTIQQELAPADELAGESAPDGLAAHVVAAALARYGIEEDNAGWALRRLLFEDEHSWKALTLDVRRSLPTHQPERFDQGLSRWHQALSRHSTLLTHRYFELLLNAADDLGRIRTMRARLAELQSVEHLLWWDHPGPNNDIREAIASRSPFGGFSGYTGNDMKLLAEWLAKPPSALELAPLDGQRSHDSPDRWGYLSSESRRRWECLSAAAAFSRERQYAPAQWELIRKWIQDPPLEIGRLPENDRHAFLAVLIEAWDQYDSSQNQLIDQMARWLTSQASWTLSSIRDWPAQLAAPPGSDVVNRRRPLLKTLLLELEEGQDRAGRRPADANG